MFQQRLQAGQMEHQPNLSSTHAGATEAEAIVEGAQALATDPAKQLTRLTDAGKGAAARMYLAAVQEALDVGGDLSEAFVKGLLEHAAQE